MPPKKAILKNYCGIYDVPKGYKRGTIKDCIDAKQVRYYGRVKIDNKTLHNLTKKVMKIVTKNKKVLQQTKKKSSYDDIELTDKQFDELIYLIKEEEKITKELNLIRRDRELVDELEKSINMNKYKNLSKKEKNNLIKDINQDIKTINKEQSKIIKIIVNLDGLINKRYDLMDIGKISEHDKKLLSYLKEREKGKKLHGEYLQEIEELEELIEQLS